MKPNLIKRNIIIEILKKNNVLLQEHVSTKNTYFFNNSVQTARTAVCISFILHTPIVVSATHPLDRHRDQ